MNKELIQELRAITAAGMADCKNALVETNGDLQKAVDYLKAKGLNIVSGREGKVAAEGVIKLVCHTDKIAGMVEINSQTDFVARSDDFRNFVNKVSYNAAMAFFEGKNFDPSILDPFKQDLINKTKENIVIRRWGKLEVSGLNSRVFAYLHSNKQICSILSVQTTSEKVVFSDECTELGNNLVMQIAAMNPLTVSPETLSKETKDRQQSIFETQLKDANKPQAAWAKIIEGKFNKWYTEVCLLNQEAVFASKKSVKQVLQEVEQKLDGKINIVDFLRYQVGENLETEKSDFVNEVQKMAGV